jgi:hypothetical protein
MGNDPVSFAHLTDTDFSTLSLPTSVSFHMGRREASFGPATLSTPCLLAELLKRLKDLGRHHDVATTALSF